MPSLSIKTLGEINEKSSEYPIAIIKGDERNEHFNKFLCVDNDDDKGEKKIDLPCDLIYQMVPSTKPDKRNVYYISGSSGCGKSYQAKILASNYQKLYPDRDVYLVSKLKEDSTLDSMKKPLIRVEYKEIVEEAPDIADLQPSMWLFDDFDTLEKKDLAGVQNFIDSICIMGRHSVITPVIISHHLTNYKQTRLILNEQDWLMLYPQSTSAHALRYVLMQYCGMDKDDVKGLRKLGRWVAIHTNYPQLVVSQNSAYMLHVD